MHVIDANLLNHEWFFIFIHIGKNRCGEDKTYNAKDC